MIYIQKTDEGRVYIGISPDGPRKTTKKNLNEDMRWPGRNSNRAPLEWKSRALRVRQLAQYSSAMMQA
jgi:hypothetical protein